MKTAIGLRSLAAIAALVLAGASAEAADGRPASELGPEVQLAEASGGYVGRLAVEPPQGQMGTPITVTGQGLPAGEEFDLVWRTSKARWNVTEAEYHGREYTPVGYSVAKVTVGDDGTFAATFEAPDDFGFWHDITLEKDGRLFTQSAFHVDMSVDIEPKSGPAGTMVTVDVKGIGRKQLQNSWLLLYDNKYTGWMSSVRTGGSARFTIPAAGKPGRHVIQVLHGDFTFPYRNMQQSPEPDRPTFALNFDITEDPAVLPPSPEDQAQTTVRRLPPQGDLVAEPRFANVGEPVVVTAEGFEPNKTYTVNWTTVVGNRVSGSGFEEHSRPLLEATADADGKLSFGFDTPDDLGGAHTMWVDTGGAEKKGTFWIAPSAASLPVNRGPAGSDFTLNLKGVGWSETANIYAVVYDNAYIGYACGFNSQGTVDVHLKATGEPGWHYVDLYPAVYKGKERRPNNFRLPQLTYDADHPGEDLPRFRFAYEVTDPKLN